MKEDLFLSREEFRRRQNEIRNRQERLIQVREQSRKMAAAVVAQMKDEAEKQYQETENRILSEIREYYSRELSAIRQQYNECVSEINQQHYMKLVGVNEKNKPLTFRRKPVILKKPIQESNSKNYELKRTVAKKIESKKESEPVSKEKSSITTSTSGNPSSTSAKKCNTLQHVSKNEAKSRLENIVVDSDADDDILLNDNRRRTSASPNLRRGILKKSVVYQNKEDYGIPRKAISRDTTMPVEQITNNMLNSDRVSHDNNEKNSSELYNRLVHDRIRVLEQKEKILSRRLPSPLIISNVIFPKKPARFTEYFSDFRSQSAAHPRTSNHSSKNDNSHHKTGENEVEKNFARVQLKKKLLALELANAETQTEKIASPSTAEFDQRTDSAVRSPSNGSADKETSSPSPHDTSNNTNSKSIAKVLCPSPIPKETESSEDKPRAEIDVKPKKNCRCRRKQLRKNDDIIVTVSSNKTQVITNSSDTSSSALASDCFNPHSSAEKDSVPADKKNSHKTVKVIVNVLSGNECKKNHRKPPEKQKNVTYATPDSNFKKTSNWKSIFENDEKLTESSYFSPPEMRLKNVKFAAKPATDFESEKDPATLEKENQPHDLGYYVAKLLMMSPESVENLNVSTSESTAVSECDDKPNSKDKVPLNVPLYQNSLDETLDTFFDDRCKQGESVQDNSVSTSGFDESVDISLSAYLKKNVSSLSGSSCSQTNTVATSNASHVSSPGNQLQRLVKDSTKTSDHTVSENVKRRETDDFEDRFTLPSLEELKKLGFGGKLFTDRTFNDDRDVREEDIVEEILKVRFPASEERVADSSASSVKKTAQTVPVVKIDFEKHPVSSNDVDSAIQGPPFGGINEFEKQPSLRGWMGTTLKRTLEASAITSTSSGDSSDTVRRALTTFEKPFEGISELRLQSESTISERKSSLSPLKVPDFRLSIPSDIKNTL